MNRIASTGTSFTTSAILPSVFLLIQSFIAFAVVISPVSASNTFKAVSTKSFRNITPCLIQREFARWSLTALCPLTVFRRSSYSLLRSPDLTPACAMTSLIFAAVSPDAPLWSMERAAKMLAGDMKIFLSPASTLSLWKILKLKSFGESIFASVGKTVRMFSSTVRSSRDILLFCSFSRYLKSFV